MALPILRQRTNLNGGTHQGVNILALPDIFSPEGSVNLRLSQMGTAEVVEGWQELNPVAMTSTNGDPLTITGLYHFRSSDSSGNILRREVAVGDDGTDEVEVWHSLDEGVTWTRLYALPSAAVGGVPSFAQFGVDLYIAQRGSPVLKYDGTTVTPAGQTQPTAPTVAATGNPGVLNGQYLYKYSHIATDGSVGPASVASANVSAVNGQVDVTITSVPASNLVRIWRTLGDGFVFFRVADFDTSSGTVYTDNIDDTTIRTQGAEPDIIGDPPPQGTNVVVNHRSRLYFLGFNIEVAGETVKYNAFRYSDPNIPDSVGDFNEEFIGQGQDGDAVIAAVPDFGGELIALKENSIWRISGTSRVDFNIIRSMASRGTISKNAVLVIPGAAKYTDAQGNPQEVGIPQIVYMTPEDARIFDGNTDKIVSWAMQDYFAEMSYQFRRFAWVAPHPDYNWVVFGIPISDGMGGFKYRQVAWDTSRGSWHEVNIFPPATSVTIAENDNDKFRFFAGGTNLTAGGGAGKVYEFFTGNSAGGADITAVFRSKPLDGAAPDFQKVLMGHDLLFSRIQSPGGNVNATVNYYEGFNVSGANPFSTYTIDIDFSGNERLVNSLIYPKNTLGAWPRDEAFVFDVAVTSQQRWSFHGWTLMFQVLPGMQHDP